MHLISRKALKEFWEVHPQAQAPLERWFNLMNKSDFSSFAEIKALLPSTDYVEGKLVFDIGGNKFRLIAVAHFNRSRLYIRAVLTHEEYNRGHWKH